MKPAQKRRKGHSFEREVCRRLRGALGLPEIKRGIQTRGGGGEAGDVIGVPGLHIECKHQDRPNPWAALKQATDDCNEETPVAVLRRNGGEEMVCMRWGGFVLMLQAVMRLKRRAGRSSRRGESFRAQMDWPDLVWDVMLKHHAWGNSVLNEELESMMHEAYLRGRREERAFMEQENGEANHTTKA